MCLKWWTAWPAHRVGYGITSARSDSGGPQDPSYDTTRSESIRADTTTGRGQVAPPRCCVRLVELPPVTAASCYWPELPSAGFRSWPGTRRFGLRADVLRPYPGSTPPRNGLRIRR